MTGAGSVVLDTSVVIAHLRNDPELTARLATASRLFVPWIVAGELYYGALRAQRKADQLALIRDFLDGTEPLLPGVTTPLRYGEIKSELSQAGSLIPENDIWIAAITRQYNMPLVTRDAHFKAVQRMETLAW